MSVKLGIIGCGVIGQFHAKGAAESDRIELVAVADLREELAVKTAKQYSAAHTFTSADELINSDVEAVVLAVPAGFRGPLAEKTLAAGKHLLLEKPVAMNAEQARSLLAVQGDLIVGCCSSRYRFTRSAQIATEMVASGTIGEVRVMRCRVTSGAATAPGLPPPPWRVSKSMNGGGVLVNWGTYDLDVLLGVTGFSLEPSQVMAQAWPVPPMFASRLASGSDAEEHVAAIIRFEGGAVLQLEIAEQFPGPSEDILQLSGTCGSLHLNNKNREGSSLIHLKGDSESGVVSKVLLEGPDGVDINSAVVQDFGSAVLEKRPPKTSLQQALMIVRITDAIYESAETGGSVLL